MLFYIRSGKKTWIYNSSSGSNHSTLKKLFKKNDIDTSHFTGVLWSKGKTRKDDKRIKSHVKWEKPEDILINPCPTTRRVLRNFLLRNNIIEYKCSYCGNDGHWRGKEIGLELDHIDGNEENAKINNLRFLCPNCHATTNTYRGKNKNKKIIQE